MVRIPNRLNFNRKSEYEKRTFKRNKRNTDKGERNTEREIF